MKRLPIGALEAFVLAQATAPATVEELAEATGLEVGDVMRVARHLVELGAMSIDGGGPSSRVKEPRASSRPPPPELIPLAAIPSPRRHADLRSLGIGPREGFVLSQIDGSTCAEDLIAITDLSHRELSDALHALEAVGAIELPTRRRRTTRAPEPRPTKAPPSRSKTPARRSTKAPAARPTKAPTPRATKAPAARRSSAPAPRSTRAPAPRATKSPAPRSTRAPTARSTKAPAPRSTKAPPRSTSPDLSDADEKLIAETSARLPGLDHYAVLGVELDAEPKVIRRAYHRLAAQFHPDRFFRKNLGSSRAPLEKIFITLTAAYETLSDKSKRAAYDRGLPPRPRAPAASQRAPVEAVVPGPPVSPVAPAPAPPAVVDPPPVSAAPAPPPPPPAPPPAPSSADPLRRMYATKKRDAAREHVEVFVRAAKEALARDDVVAAANHYRLATQSSDDPELHRALEETDQRARRRVRESSLDAARVAEQAGRWAEAGEKYAKAHGVRAEAWVAERAAHALLRDGKDLRRAAQLGEQAVLAEPGHAGFRVTLGEIYLEAGLLARAAGEAARALALAPADPRASALSARVAKRK